MLVFITCVGDGTGSGVQQAQPNGGNAALLGKHCVSGDTLRGSVPAAHCRGFWDRTRTMSWSPDSTEHPLLEREFYRAPITVDPGPIRG